MPREPGQCFLEPEWSPDGQWIVASAPLEGDGQWSFPMTRQVLRISRDGQTRTTLATIVHENKDCTRFEVAFSPDGKQVAYVDGRCQARLVQVDGSGGEVPLTEFPIWWTSAVYPQWGAEKKAPPPEAKPAARPAGKIVEHCPDAKPPQLCVREVPSEQVTQVTDDLSFEAIFGSVWSPDGQQIVFDAGAAPDAGRHDHKLYLINADGSGLKPITGGDTNDLMPAWSPDGEWIAFHRNCALWRIRPNGAEARMLLPGSDQFCAAEIVWSPDSQRIALLNTNEKTPWEVWVANREGADQRLVHVFEQRLEWAQVLWSPDGGQLAVWYQDAGGVQGRLINADGGGEPQPIQEYERIRAWYPSFWPPWGDRLP
jgi:Tol biopolymer transport system component